MDLGENRHSSRPDIYIVSMTFENLGQKVQECLPGVTVVELKVQPSGGLSTDDVDTLKKNAEVLLCGLSLIKNIILEMNKVKWIQALSTGVNMLNMNFKESPGFRLTRTTWNCTIVAEYVITHILAREKQLLEMYESQKCSKWQQLKFAAKRQIKELRICIIGVGTIGQAIAKHCKRFGMFVYGVTRTDKSYEQSDLINEYHTVQTLPHVLQSVDYICCCVPSTAETTNMLSGDILSVCKSKKPILVNVGRGNLINEETLVRGVKEGWLGGAVLDVLPEEPLPANSELWVLPNVTITPHISGYNRDEQMLDRYVSTFVENYQRYCEGKPLINEVKYDRHY